MDEELLGLVLKYINDDFSKEEKANFEIMLRNQPEVEKIVSLHWELNGLFQSERSNIAVRAVLQKSEFSTPYKISPFVTLYEFRALQHADIDFLDELYKRQANLILKIVRTDNRLDIRKVTSLLNQALLTEASFSFIYERFYKERFLTKNPRYPKVTWEDFIFHHFRKSFEHSLADLYRLLVQKTNNEDSRKFDWRESHINNVMPVLREQITEDNKSSSIETSLKRSIWRKELKSNLQQIQQTLTHKYILGPPLPEEVKI